jgi:TfoX/Sxy family transcriptional regulator of competence genes
MTAASKPVSNVSRFQEQLDQLMAAVGISGHYQITYKSVFGAVAAYANDRIFLTCGTFDTAVKLDAAACKSLLDDGDGKPLKYFAKGHVKKGYVDLSDTVLNNPARLRELVKTSAAYVQEAD